MLFRSDPTNRDIHADVDRYGQIGNTQYSKPQLFDNFNATPDPTNRDIHADVDRYGHVGNSQYYKSPAFDNFNATPDPTMRNIHEDNQYNGPVGYHEKETCREDAMNSQVNIMKEVVASGRAPTTSNYEKCPTIEGTMVQLCDNIQINRDLYPDITQQVTPKTNTVYTRASHELPNDEWRFNTFVVDNLQGNQYINNTQHKSVNNNNIYKY